MQFRALTELRSLDDVQMCTMVLGNWHKLNTVLRCRPTVQDLQRLLVLELLSEARPDILRRLRAALSRAHGRVAELAMADVIDACVWGKKPKLETLLLIGLDRESAGRIV